MLVLQRDVSPETFELSWDNKQAYKHIVVEGKIVGFARHTILLYVHLTWLHMRFFKGFSKSIKPMACG